MICLPVKTTVASCLNETPELVNFVPSKTSSQLFSVVPIFNLSLRMNLKKILKERIKKLFNISSKRLHVTFYGRKIICQHAVQYA